MLATTHFNLVNHPSCLFNFNFYFPTSKSQLTLQLSSLAMPRTDYNVFFYSLLSACATTHNVVASDCAVWVTANKTFPQRHSHNTKTSTYSHRNCGWDYNLHSYLNSLKNYKTQMLIRKCYYLQWEKVQNINEVWVSPVLSLDGHYG